MLFSHSGGSPGSSSVKWTSAVLPTRDQFAAWREATCQHVYAVTPERERSTAGFRGRIEGRRVGGIDVLDVQSEAHRVLRTASDIRRYPSDTYYVYVQLGQAAWFLQNGRHLLVSRGDIVIADPNIEFSTGPFGDFDFRIFRVPRPAVDRYLAAPRHLPMVRLRFDSPEGALIRGCLSSLWAHGEALDPRVQGPMADALVRLIALGMGVAPDLAEAVADAVQGATVSRAEHYIERHFADPRVSPSSAAKALGVSVRKLHLSLAPTGRSFGERLAERRLEEARLLLTSATAGARPIAEVAFAVGFADLSTFYRAFRAKWGATPGEFRNPRLS